MLSTMLIYYYLNAVIYFALLVRTLKNKIISLWIYRKTFIFYIFYKRWYFWTFAKINQRKHIFSPFFNLLLKCKIFGSYYEFTSGETISWQSEQSSFLLWAIYAWCQTKYYDYAEVCQKENVQNLWKNVYWIMLCTKSMQKVHFY